MTTRPMALFACYEFSGLPSTCNTRIFSSLPPSASQAPHFHTACLSWVCAGVAGVALVARSMASLGDLKDVVKKFDFYQWIE